MLAGGVECLRLRVTPACDGVGAGVLDEGESAIG